MSGPLPRRRGVWSAVGVPILVLFGLCAIRDIRAQERADILERGRAIYGEHCAGCHGRNGDGRGPDAEGLSPLPRDLTQANFRFRTTRFGKLPLDGDLDRTIRTGIAGTEMDAFEGVLDAEQRRAVIAYVKTFSAAWRDPRFAPGPLDLYKIPDERPFPRTEQTVAAGEALYERLKCHACHGVEGRGDGPGTRVLDDDRGQWLAPYDWSCGVYKSGTEERDLYRTIVTGTNGAEMRGYGPALTEEERWQLVDYVVSFSERRSTVSKLLACGAR